MINVVWSNLKAHHYREDLTKITDDEYDSADDVSHGPTVRTLLSLWLHEACFDVLRKSPVQTNGFLERSLCVSIVLLVLRACFRRIVAEMVVRVGFFFFSSAYSTCGQA